MGFFSWCKSAYNSAKDIVKNAYNSAKDIAKSAYGYVKEKVCNGVAAVKEVVKNAWDNVTGNKAKRISEEAKALYEEIKKKYEEAVSTFESNGQRLSSEISTLLDKINEKKKYIITYLFDKLKRILSKIKYQQRYAKEHKLEFDFTAEKMRSQSNLIMIDFEENPIKSRLKAILTLGFWANKQARESLDRVKEEEAKINDCIGKMSAEISRLENVKKALNTTLKYLCNMIDIYEAILVKAESAANYLRFKCLSFTHKICDEYCQLQKLPKADQDLLYSLFNTSVILDTMAKMQLKSNADYESINEYNKVIEQQQEKFGLAA